MAESKVPSTKAEVNAHVTKEYNEAKEQILEGTVNVIPNCEYRAKSIYNFQGLGIYSGLYYIKKATHTIRNGSYTVTLSVFKKDNPGESGGGNGKGDAGEENTTSPRREEAKLDNTYVKKIVVDKVTGGGTWS